MTRPIDADDPFEEEEYRRRTVAERFERAAEKGPDPSRLEQARHDFAELRMGGASRGYALALVTGRYGVGTDDVLRAQAEADTNIATGGDE